MASQQSLACKSGQDMPAPPVSEPHDNSRALVPHVPAVEEYISTSVAIVDAPPEAPEPPPNVNVFDFLIPNGEDDGWESDRDDDGDMRPEPSSKYLSNGFPYGNGHVATNYDRFDSQATLGPSEAPNDDFVTPAPKKGHSRNMSIDSTGAKKSGKRKRGQPEGLDLAKDVVMTDVPPATFHTGLTGGMNRLMTQKNGFPPSPDLSGDAKSPQSPIKRGRHDKENHRDRKPRRRSDSERDEKRKKSSHSSGRREDVARRDKNGNVVLERRRNRKRSASPAASNTSPHGRHKKQLKAIEYPAKDKEDMSRALVKIDPHATQVEHAPTTRSVGMFLDCLAKGSETDEGVSVWKALKRWKNIGGSGEKDLWKGLRVRANDNGELVLCVLSQ